MKTVKRIAIVAKRKSVRSRTGRTLKRFGYRVVDKRPDLVVSIGGDGTYLHAERVFPNVPKLLIRDSNLCLKCNDESLRVLLNACAAGTFKRRGFLKLEGVIEKGHARTGPRVAANDVVVRNREQTQAIRFAVKVDGKDLDGTMIGDGIVIATPFGSEAYYKTITGMGFQKGLGTAFTTTLSPLRMGTIRGSLSNETRAWPRFRVTTIFAFSSTTRPLRLPSTLLNAMPRPFWKPLPVMVL